MRRRPRLLNIYNRYNRYNHYNRYNRYNHYNIYRRYLPAMLSGYAPVYPDKSGTRRGWTPPQQKINE